MTHIPHHQRSRDNDSRSHSSSFYSPYDPHIPQYAPADLDTQFSMAYLPLPVDTPLPASAFPTPNAAYNHPAHSPHQGPTGHPLYEGVVGMHYLLSQGMTWTEYNGYNSSRNNSQNDDDLFCQNPAPLVPLPIRPAATRLSSQSSLQSWQSDCTEQDTHPEASSSFRGSPLSTSISSTAPTSPPQSSDAAITFQGDVRGYMLSNFFLFALISFVLRSPELLVPPISPTLMPQASSGRNLVTESGIYSLLVWLKVEKAGKNLSRGPTGV